MKDYENDTLRKIIDLRHQTNNLTVGKCATSRYQFFLLHKANKLMVVSRQRNDTLLSFNYVVSSTMYDPFVP